MFKFACSHLHVVCINKCHCMYFDCLAYAPAFVNRRMHVPFSLKSACTSVGQVWPLPIFPPAIPSVAYLYF